MRIARARVLPYAVALRVPLVTSAATITHRRGFLLEITTDGVRGYGECAPVWWLGEGSVEAADFALAEAAELLTATNPATVDLHALFRTLDGVCADENGERTAAVAVGEAAAAPSTGGMASGSRPLEGSRGFDTTSGREPSERRAGREATSCDEPAGDRRGRDSGPASEPAAGWRDRLTTRWRLWPPSVRSALVTAVLDVEARASDAPLARLLAQVDPCDRLPVARLLDGENEIDLASSARAAVAVGFETVKLKVGAGTVAADVARLRRVREEVGARVAIRLDANRAWSVDQAREALDAMGRFEPVLVEEPLRGADPIELARLRESSPMAIALDESVVTAAELRAFLLAESLDVLVLKLGRVGGPLQAATLATAAARRGVATIVTDAIETAVGRAAALHVAAALPGEAQAAGLGGAFVLAEDVARGRHDHRPVVPLPQPGLGVVPGVSSWR